MVEEFVPKVESKYPTEPVAKAEVPEEKVEVDDDSELKVIAKLKKEKNNYAEELRAIKEKLRQKETEEFEKTQNFKAIADRNAQEANELRKRLEDTQEQIAQGRKNSEIKNELTKVGLKPQYLEEVIRFIPKESVAYDHETGIVTGHKEAVKNILQKFPPLFGSSIPNVDHSAPVGSVKELSVEDYKNMTPEQRREFKKANLYRK